MMVQSWEALISRRQTVNTVYVSAAAVLLTGVGVLLATGDRIGVVAAALGAALLACLGAGLSFNWRRTLRSYGILSKAKADVVGAMEAHMPAQPFDAEWKVMESKRYKSTTVTDGQTAFFFMLLFAAIALVTIGIAVGQLF